MEEIKELCCWEGMSPDLDTSAPCKLWDSNDRGSKDGAMGATHILQSIRVRPEGSSTLTGPLSSDSVTLVG